MLFKQTTLAKIKAGEVDLAFRQWKKPTVKINGTLITAAGQLRIDSIESVELYEILDEHVTRAGFETKDALLMVLKPDPYKEIFQIQFHLEGEDPRIGLRNEDRLDEKEIEEILQKLARWDKSSKQGPWTLATLKIIHDHPESLSTKLAEQLGFERMWLKTQIRKLKGLGLTISLDVGYKMSPRGVVVLNAVLEKK